jgi:acyl carrier protein
LNSFVSSIHAAFGVSISVTEVFNFSNLQQMSTFIFKQLRRDEFSLALEKPNEEEVINAITNMVSAKLGLEIGPEEPLLASGLDSVTVVDLTSAISNYFGVELRETDLIDLPNIRDVSQYIISNHISKVECTPSLDLSNTVKNKQVLSLCAVSYTYPFDSNNDISRIIVHGESDYDNVRNVPLNRWDKTDMDRIDNSTGMMSLSSITFRLLFS